MWLILSILTSGSEIASSKHAPSSNSGLTFFYYFPKSNSPKMDITLGHWEYSVFIQ